MDDDRHDMPHLARFPFCDRITLNCVDAKTGKPVTAKISLASVRNGWLHANEKEAAHAMAQDPEVTEAQAEAELKRLEVLVSERLAYWRVYQ